MIWGASLHMWWLDVRSATVQSKRLLDICKKHQWLTERWLDVRSATAQWECKWWLDIGSATARQSGDWMLGASLLKWIVDWISGAPLHREQWLDVRIATVQMELWLDVHTRCRGLIECDCGVSTLGWFRIFQIFKAVKLTTLNGTAFWKHVAFVKMQQLHFFMWDKWSKMGKKWVHVWKKNYSWVSTTAAETVFNECVHLKMLWMC